MTTYIVTILIILAGITFSAKKPEVNADNFQKDTLYTEIETNVNGNGLKLEITFLGGDEQSHASMAIWTETLDEQFIQSLYVTKSIATGIFQHGNQNNGIWEPGEIDRPAALPYWAHKRGIKNTKGSYNPEPSNPIPDAYTGATPEAHFILKTQTDSAVNKKFRLLLEINQSFDWNEYWHNTRFPENENYKTSCQPSLIYAVTIDPEKPEMTYYLNPIGHGHYSGENGNLYTDLSNFTTALDIVAEIKVRVISKDKN